MSVKKLYFVAGEASGDLQGALLIRALKKENPSLICRGLGGELMRSEGMEILHDLTKEAVLGLGDVLAKYFYFRNIFNETTQDLERFRPDAVVLIDYPGFNLRLASKIAGRFPVIYYVSPQIWAWGKWRIHSIRKTVRHMIVFFGFEEELYKQAGVPVTWVGHPLADLVKPSKSKENLRREFLSPSPHPLPLSGGEEKGDGVKVVALLPGSRETEVKRILPEMLAACSALRKQISETEFIVSESSTVKPALYEEVILKAGLGFPLQRVRNRSYDVLHASDFALVSSGTATIETALLAIPFVILYKTAWSTFFLGRRLIQIPYIGLANVVAGRKVVPEFIQHEINPQAIAQEAAHLMVNEELRQKMIKDLKEVQTKLGRGGAPERAAQAILRFLAQKKGTGDFSPVPSSIKR